MPELTPTGAVEVVERQVRRVRRRKNLYELQAACYWTIVAGGLAAMVLLPVALFARAEVFAVAAWSALAALLLTLALLARGARRGWLSRPATVAWIETRSTLAGRVRTLLEIGRRPAVSTGFFHPLLVSEVHATLPAWTPARLVPRAVPWRALASAFAVMLALAALVRAATLVSPAPPSVGMGAGPGVPGEGAERASEGPTGDRVITAPGADARTSRASAGRAGRGSDGSALTQYSSALQENVRERVWGKAWERVRDALARAGTSNAALDHEDGAAGEEIDAEGTDEVNVAGDGRGGKHQAGAGDDADTDDATHDERPEANADVAANQRGDGDGTSGAGNGTSPGDLFSGSAVDTADRGASFELSLAARMRSDKTGRRQAGGPPPDADPDARPALADDQRRESAAHRMTVPAAYEQVVREVFAHREEP